MARARSANHYIRTGLPEALPDFSHINRYYDPKQETFAAKILPGEFYVSQHGEMIVTVLGSCVAACIRDVKLGVGGMNHFMLPFNRGAPASRALTNQQIKDVVSDSARYGNWAMEYLINSILKCGGNKQDLEVKLFGGGKVLDAIQAIEIGRDNIDFVKKYLETEGLKLVASDLGLDFPRKVLYFSDTGAVKIKRMHKIANSTVIEREISYVKDLDGSKAGDIDIF